VPAGVEGGRKGAQRVTQMVARSALCTGRIPEKPLAHAATCIKMKEGKLVRYKAGLTERKKTRRKGGGSVEKDVIASAVQGDEERGKAALRTAALKFRIEKSPAQQLPSSSRESQTPRFSGNKAVSLSAGRNLIKIPKVGLIMIASKKREKNNMMRK